MYLAITYPIDPQRLFPFTWNRCRSNLALLPMRKDFLSAFVEFIFYLPLFEDSGEFPSSCKPHDKHLPD
jgi:hypothetical protein